MHQKLDFHLWKLCKVIPVSERFALKLIIWRCLKSESLTNYGSSSEPEKEFFLPSQLEQAHVGTGKLYWFCGMGSPFFHLIISHLIPRKMWHKIMHQVHAVHLPKYDNHLVNASSWL